jgi:beta-glucosidase
MVQQQRSNMPLTFPNDFLWGTATAAHQVEGNNTNSDFWVLEHVPGTTVVEPSGDACNHYHLYRQDIKMLAELGFTSYRFSVEWARIEPEDGMFSYAALGHYRNMLNACYEHGLTPMVTLHHFTSPRWLMKLGGWTGKETPARFARYCEFVMKHLGGLIPYVCTLNEVNLPDLIETMMPRRTQQTSSAPVGMSEAASRASWTERAALEFGLQDVKEFHAFPYTYLNDGNFVETALEAHRQARAVIRQVSPKTKVGFTLALGDLQLLPGGEEHFARLDELLFLQYVPTLQEDDFFGLQNYTRTLVDANGVAALPEGSKRTQMGYEYYPEALAGVIRHVAKHLNIPIFITENGVAVDDDNHRVDFIKRALEGVHACIADGLQVGGYYYWSAFDNYEWIMGYRMTFGLIGVDRTTQERTVKESAKYLGRIAKAKGLE